MTTTKKIRFIDVDISFCTRTQCKKLKKHECAILCDQHGYAILNKKDVESKFIESGYTFYYVDEEVFKKGCIAYNERIGSIINFY